MKLLIVQLSDMHCKKDDRNNTFKIEKAVQAICTLESVDSAMLVFSGDLANTAQKNEYSVGKQMLGAFLEKLGNSLNCGFIKSFIVPGNHDIDLTGNDIRTSSDITSWNKDDHISDELKLQKNFFDYSANKFCFEKDKICDIKMLSTCGINVQVCLLNSAPFSTTKPDDKELHYIPQRYNSSLERKPEADIKITIMHHHFEWCDWNTKEMIKKSISSDDLTFFGHDHKSEQISSAFADGKIHNIIMGGEFAINIEKDSSFNAFIYDTDNQVFDSYLFDWDKEWKLFKKTNNGKISKKASHPMPSYEYLEKLKRDPQSICSCFIDYYVFPKLIVETDSFNSSKNEKIISEKEIFNALRDLRAIRITGENGTGKTSLLKYLYVKAIDECFIPVLIEKKDYKDSNIDKMLSSLFEEQYSMNSRIASDYFEQIDKSKILILIDDTDLIKSDKARNNLLKRILERGYLMIYTAREKDQDLEELVKNQLQGKEISTLCIPQMFKESRDSLIDNVGSLLNKDIETIEGIKNAFDYLVQSQANLFSFTPANMLQYIKYFMNEGNGNKNSVQTLSLVFESNIRNALFNVCTNETALLYLSALEYIADKMYFEFQAEHLEISEFISIISDFNNERRCKIKDKDFLDVCTKANLFIQKENSFNVCFYDNNSYAYFVAKAVSREFEKDNSKLEKVNYLMNHICFGINDTVILFLSFIRSNSNIIISIAKKAEQLLGDYSEWDFDSNLPFMREDSILHASLPSKKDIKNNTEIIEQIEQEHHNSIQFRGIFDYSEEDINKRNYVVLRAFKYTQLVSRALADQYGSLTSEDIDTFLDTIFKIPQKVIYAILKPYQDNYDSIINSLVEFAKERLPDENISEAKIKRMFSNTATVLALNIMNDIAFNSSNPSTIDLLRSGPNDVSNYKILELMMEENADDSDLFVSKAIELRKEFKNNSYASALISQIARKHVIYHSNINHKLIDRLISGKIFSENSKSSLLLERGQKSFDS